jgi:uncharacterized protein YpmS
MHILIKIYKTVEEKYKILSSQLAHYKDEETFDYKIFMNNSQQIQSNMKYLGAYCNDY